MFDMHDIVIGFDHVAASARRHMDDGRRPTIALARALDEHVGGTTGTIGVRIAIDCAQQIGVDLRVLLIEDDLALLVNDAPGSWSGLLPDFGDGITWVPVPASTLLAMDAKLLCDHDAARALATH